ncbi:ExeM/NucH family extracellular endonuclease [Demequina sp. SYSU T00192]|uniref:ExeM/NucH family extracellular endonuclease n=1 Tax=Demequina litoralis TaxID=3051660 RepID=A0ABT8G6W4_9MICO|nr:ExeM/NucH family extracellular endonuclease [Demequina sp. SYSU T00192]MDN4474807.1 ExeM/NucH family extracellular endonuclease [Demequina sp. SYSU T00192]
MHRRLIAPTMAAALAATAIVASPAGAAAPDLFFSEYVEGSGYNKAVEIYNGTGAAVDLADYAVLTFQNGVTERSAEIPLTGTLAAGDVYVLASGNTSTTNDVVALADQTSGSVLWNGDDALQLVHAGTVVDVLGVVGERPSWGANVTLRRAATVCAGAAAYDASQWEPFASNTVDGLGAHAASCDGGPVVDAPPALASSTPADGDAGVSAAASIEVAFTEPVAAGGAFALACDDAPVAATVAGGPTTWTVTPEGDLPDGAACVLTVSGAAVTDLDDVDPPDAMADDATVAFTVADGPTLIHDVQGTGDTAAMVGQTVTIEGVVVGDYEGPSPTLRGFYVQEEDADADADPATSEAIFVYHGSADTVEVGDLVSVTGRVAEYFGQTQLGYPSALSVLDTGLTVTPAAVSLPFADADEAERYEGMLVSFDQTLTVTELYELGRFGEVTVSSGGRLDQPTAVVEPGADAIALQAANDLRTVIVDDATNAQNPATLMGRGGDPLTADNTLRGGDTVTGLTGVMTFGYDGYYSTSNAWRVRPVSDRADLPVFDADNARPTEAPAVGGDVQVASFNVLNYFLTLDAYPHQCGPVGFEQDCRGAWNATELERQTDKLVAALAGLDADVIGIMEMENTTGVEPLATLSAELNAYLGTDSWTYVDTGTIGTDTIRVGILYDAAVVTELGGFAVLDSSVDPRFDDSRNRPSLAQSFVTEDDAAFTVVTNHLKSKGSCPADGADADQGDGAGCWNASRTSAVEALVDWLGSDPTGVHDADALVIGDLNSYAMEDPIDVLREAGYVELGGGDYSYVFSGQWGSLDYTFASPSLATQVTDSAHVHINADEPAILDYTTRYKPANLVGSLYAPDWFRTSDHDPVLLGLDLELPDAVVTVGEPHGAEVPITLRNQGDAPLAGWTLTWEVPAGESVVNVARGDWTQDGTTVTVTGRGAAATLEPGEEITLRIIGGSVPSALQVDGERASVVVG